MLAMIQNLDLECAKLAETLAQQMSEQVITKALGVLEEQGLYAYFLFLKSSKEKEIKKEDKEEIINRCYSLLQDNLSLKNNSKDIFEKIQGLATDLDNLLLARDLLRQALVYARYHAKAKEKEKST